MPLREADRRGRRMRGGTGLLEREDTLAAIGDVLEAAVAGVGAGLLISGHPGMGKTRLHEATLDEARRSDVLVLRAAGSELEQNLAFGVAAQLLRSMLSEAEHPANVAARASSPRGPNPRGLRPSKIGPEAGEDLAASHACSRSSAGAASRVPR